MSHAVRWWVPAAALFLLAAARQPATLSGTWQATVPEAVRNQDGLLTVESTTTAMLELAVRGDSVTGTIRRGASRVSRPVAGVIRGNAVTLEGATRARAYVNGVDHELALVITYRFTLKGDTLRGTVETRRADPKDDFTLPGVEQDPLPIVAVRVPPR